ncbi:hypothetical protein EOM81_11505, partial [bacterium]|nr:hypothetical protein [bacterium]
MKKLVNLTPHVLNVLAADGSIIDIQPSGNIARVSSNSDIVATINGINVSQQAFGDVTGLPAARDGVIFIVSRMVKDRVLNRSDVLVPGAPVRDADGKILLIDEA